MIKVLIERIIIPGLEKEYQDAIRRTLQQAMSANGYISGESLKDMNNSCHRVIITLWRDQRAWQEWYRSEERLRVLAEVAPLLSQDEKITLLEHI